jgi:phosphomannomutase
VSARADLTLIRFGTDGWRAPIAEDFTFANLERVAQAYSDYLQRSCHEENPAADSAAPLVIIGYDRRFLSEQFAERVAEILTGNNLRIALFDEAVPTPIVSWAVKSNAAAGGVVITASHNPATFNGFKIKAPWGGSASPEITSIVESLVDAQPPRRRSIKTSDEPGILKAAIASYRAQVSSYIDLERIQVSGMKVIIDSMHGSGGRWVESFLRTCAASVETIRAERDP